MVRGGRQVGTLLPISPVIALGAFALIFVPCMMAGQALASGVYADLVAVGILMAIMFPLAFVLVAFGERNQRRTDEKVRNLNIELSSAVADAERLNSELSAAMSDADLQAEIRDAQVQRQRFESRLANVLDMAEGEPEVIEVIERSFATVLPEAPAELLLADNSHAHLHRMAAVGPDEQPPSCGVDSPDRCPAALGPRYRSSRTATTWTPVPSCATAPKAACQPSVCPCRSTGRTVGVIHATGEVGAKVEDDRVDDLATLAKLAGARIGLLRVMAEKQHRQASTDTLTGLLNRRSFSERVAAIPAHLYPVAMAMADLDHFKILNDTYRSRDGRPGPAPLQRVSCATRCGPATSLSADGGGEEFAIAFPDCSSVERGAGAQHRALPTRRGRHRRRPPEVHRELRGHRVRTRRGAGDDSAAGRRRAAARQACGSGPGRAARRHE